MHNVLQYWKDSVVIRSQVYPRFIGAPLDGVTNVPFRKTIRLFSPAVLLYTEMCHADTIVQGDYREWALDSSDIPVNFQVAAADETYIMKVCERLVEAGITMVDLNIGCPAGSVVKDGKGAGSALMGDITRLRHVVRMFREHLSCILTVKMRSGFRKNVALDVAKMLEELGIEAICVHPRLQIQKFSGEPDYALLAQIKKAVSIPVLVSGGITSFAVAETVYEQTGVDGFLVGRALIGKPWLLHQLNEQSQGRSFEIISDHIRHALLYHVDASVQWFGPSRGLALFKKHLKIYLEQLNFSREQAVQLLQQRCPEQFKKSFDKFLFKNE